MTENGLSPRAYRLPLPLRWTRSSFVLISSTVAVIGLVLYVWWPLAQEYLAQIDLRRPLWVQVDWLLVGIFGVMTLLIMAQADLRRDAWIAAVGLLGGGVVETWGTQVGLWSYYTLEKPPLWILPAWPIATLAIDRLHRLTLRLAPDGRPRLYAGLYWVILGSFLVLMLIFVFPTVESPTTLAAIALCAGLAITSRDRRGELLLFLAGAGLGYFLEVWGTTRQCWTYYTRETPPLFAVLAHGMASLAFMRATRLAQDLWPRFTLLWQRTSWRYRPGT